MASRLKRRAFESALSRVPPNSEEFFMVKRGFPYFYLDGICERYQQRANANATKSGESPNGNEVQPDDLESNISVDVANFALLNVEAKIKKLKAKDPRMTKLTGYAKSLKSRMMRSRSYHQFSLTWRKSASLGHYHCFKCDSHYPLKPSYLKHMVVVHNSYASQRSSDELTEEQILQLTLSCSYCDHHFATEAGLQRHNARLHKNVITKSGDGEVKRKSMRKRRTA